MNSSQLHPNHTRILGWYALRWAHITDWFRVYTQRLYRHPGYRADVARITPTPLTEQVSPATAVAVEKSQEKSAHEEKKLRQVVEESQDILAQTKTVFPFTPFPTKVTIDRHKLTIVFRKFFRVEQTVSVPIEDIKNIQADVGPFLGSLTITSDLFINNIQRINYLPRPVVKEVQKLVQGAMVAIKEGINITKIDCVQLKKQLSDLGEGHTSESLT